MIPNAEIGNQTSSALQWRNYSGEVGTRSPPGYEICCSQKSFGCPSRNPGAPPLEIPHAVTPLLHWCIKMDKQFYNTVKLRKCSLLTRQLWLYRHGLSFYHFMFSLVQYLCDDTYLQQCKRWLKCRFLRGISVSVKCDLHNDLNLKTTNDPLRSSYSIYSSILFC